MVYDAWSKEVKSYRPDCRFRDKLKNVKAALKEWSKAKFRRMKESIDGFRKKAMEWELEAEKKARVKWDLDGDENSKFFHAMIKRRNNKSNIHGLMIDGSWCENPKNIKEEIFGYYKSIFTEGDKTRPYFKCERVAKLSEGDVETLEMAIEEKEIRDAVWGCGCDKAPGPDGFNFKYIKKFWDIFKDDLVKAVRLFWEKTELSRGCNESFVTLVPKVIDPIELKDFRPIS
ncbi:hypothetical protein Tco_1533309 [Tanacetum coccineum]